MPTRQHNPTVSTWLAAENKLVANSKQKIVVTVAAIIGLATVAVLLMLVLRKCLRFFCIKRVYMTREEEEAKDRFETATLITTSLDYGTDTDGELTTDNEFDMDLPDEDQLAWIEDSLIGLPTPVDSDRESSPPIKKTRGVMVAGPRRTYDDLKRMRESPSAMIESSFIEQILHDENAKLKDVDRINRNDEEPESSQSGPDLEWADKYASVDQQTPEQIPSGLPSRNSASSDAQNENTRVASPDLEELYDPEDSDDSSDPKNYDDGKEEEEAI